jgi:hypothetical protein
MEGGEAGEGAGVQNGGGSCYGGGGRGEGGSEGGGGRGEGGLLACMYLSMNHSCQYHVPWVIGT